MLAHTGLGPEEVLALAKALERAAGRRPGPRFGPRPLDIDLLLYGNRCSNAPELTLPHPRLRERRFVLEPLAEIAPASPCRPTARPCGSCWSGCHRKRASCGWGGPP